LLRDLERVDRILGALREAVSVKFTVKTRLGFDSPDVFDTLLGILAKHSLDLVTVHGRTVTEMYRSEVHYDLIAQAVGGLPCPVLANGNVYSAGKAAAVLRETGAKGLMIGRGAIRNPWIFDQIRRQSIGVEPSAPRGRDVLNYVRALYEATRPEDFHEKSQVQKMKKYLNFLALGVEPTGRFLHQIRRVATEIELFNVCTEYLDHDQLMPLEPFPLELKDTDVLAGEHH
jgi:tRNA-dihydrouridine synthase